MWYTITGFLKKEKKGRVKMKNLRRTKITCTIGPAAEAEEMLTKLVNTGMNVARINFSHGGYEENAEKIETIKKVRTALNQPIAMCLDTKGPEIRTGKQESGDQKVEIKEGQTFTFVNEDIIGNETKTSISYKNLYQDVKPGAKILVDDGAIEFEVQEVVGKDVVCKAVNSGMLGSRKTVNIQGVVVNLPALAEKDIADISKGAQVGFDYIFASFVRRLSDVQEIRKLLDENGGQNVGIISKIESQEGIDNFEEILEASDGIMVARGDMAVEIPYYKVPAVQKHFIKRCNEVGKPVITATQMLESMTKNPRATRAEVSDVANAVYDRTSAIMLSGESAMGAHPALCVDTMVKISEETESHVNYEKRFYENRYDPETASECKTLGYTTCVTAANVNADAIIVYTKDGSEARTIGGLSPVCPIIAVTDNKQTFHKMSVYGDVFPVYTESKECACEMVKAAIEELKNNGTLETGDTLVLAGSKKDDNTISLGKILKI